LSTLVPFPPGLDFSTTAQLELTAEDLLDLVRDSGGGAATPGFDPVDPTGDGPYSSRTNFSGPNLFSNFRGEESSTQAPR